MLGDRHTPSPTAPVRTQSEVHRPGQGLRGYTDTQQTPTPGTADGNCGNQYSQSRQSHTRMGTGCGETVGFRCTAEMTSKIPTRLHIPESEEQRPVANKSQKTPNYVSRVVVKNWELRVQQQADCIRLSRTGVPEHLGGIEQADIPLSDKCTLKHSKMSWQTSSS